MLEFFLIISWKNYRISKKYLALKFYIIYFLTISTKIIFPIAESINSFCPLIVVL